MPTVQHQLGAVFDDPLDGFTAREFQRLGQGGREVDVPLLTGFALNELDFGGVTHVVSLSSYITRYQNTPQCFDPARVFIPLARSRPLKCGNLSSQTPNSRCRHSWRHRSPSWRKLSACRVETLLDARGAMVVARICPVTNVPGSVACSRTALGLPAPTRCRRLAPLGRIGLIVPCRGSVSQIRRTAATHGRAVRLPF